MNRRPVALVAAALTLAVGVVVGVSLSTDGDAARAPSAPQSQPVAASAPEPPAPMTGAAPAALTPPGPLTPRETFVKASADQLCAATSAVYENAEALAAAYAKPPSYDGLTPAQATEFTAAMTTDPALSGEVNDRLSKTCRPGEVPAATR